MKYEKEKNRKGTDDGKQIASFYGRGENNRKNNVREHNNAQKW